jgi:hypothetical protein
MHKCVTCPVGSTFNQYLYACQVIKIIKTCPTTAPFFDGEKCVACYLPKYWNHVSNACEYCPDNLNFDI